MPTFISFLLRLFLVLAGLILATSLAAAAVLGMLLWSVRAMWARLTGRPVRPFVIRIDPRTAFRRTQQVSGQPSRTPRADAVASAGEASDVTDVVPRPRAQ